MAHYGFLLLAPAEGWWPVATWRALRALWIAVWRAVLAETTAVRTGLMSLRAASTAVTTELSSCLQERCKKCDRGGGGGKGREGEDQLGFGVLMETIVLRTLLHN